MLIYILLFGSFGGCAFWVYCAFKIIFILKKKRLIKTKAEFKKSIKKYETAPGESDIKKNKEVKSHEA